MNDPTTVMPPTPVGSDVAAAHLATTGGDAHVSGGVVAGLVLAIGAALTMIGRRRSEVLSEDA
ncbi:LPXTG cell wall anchor domain-containing protein [Microbacterium galbinum]|uniref:LPXTG cell wall anchor domain-containing protein n=1 Tax=Microbacterium galbinum TaxID=2851646 RepID=A0ABY4IV71_9MICO|nr:LPXTG cell wall anchor domain-containing protein [Microbacterium galbinum]UPL15701.1 LPXTG cell wall anchor domain-containing protein [Microbacterium galbinum]